MKFDSSSLLLHGGIPAKIDVYIPSALMDVEIADDVWKKAIKQFNIELDKRPTTLTKVNDFSVDLLRLELEEDKLGIGSVVLFFVAKEENIPKIAEIHFRLTGHLTFDKESGKVDDMVIKNITYGGDDSCKYSILSNDSYNEQQQVYGGMPCST